MGTPATASARILIVEDDEGVCAALEDLCRLAGYDVEATDGPLAPRLVAEWLPDLILLDYMLPAIPGNAPALAAVIRAAAGDIPIVLMTAWQQPAAKAREVGAVSYVAKPFDVDELLRIIAAALAGRILPEAV